MKPPIFPGSIRKNDDVFMIAATRKLPFIYTYEQRTVEVVYGPSCRSLYDEIFVDKCERDGVSIVERRGGGGTVVLSPGVLVIVVVGGKEKERERATDVFVRVHNRVIAALDKTGIGGAVHAGISDIAVGGKKILGSSLYMGLRPPLFYYQASLLVECDLSLMSRYLRHPPKEPAYRSGRSHEDFCATLKDLYPQTDITKLAKIIETELGGLA